MIAGPHKLYMSVEEYLSLDHSSPDARYEFIDGIVTLLAEGTINHSRISVNLIVALDRLLHGKSCMVCNSGMRLEISATRYVYPDISVSCDPQQRAIDLYRRQTENLWTFHPFRSGDEVELKSINVRFPINSVYENVSFPEDTFS